MALPVTITSIGTDIAPLGPFKSSAGNFYLIGEEVVSGQSNFKVLKAVDPTSSWSVVSGATITDPAPFVGNEDFNQTQGFSAYQDGDTIHVMWLGSRNSTGSNAEFTYSQFNMSTETWTVNCENIYSSQQSADIRVASTEQPKGAQWSTISVRSDGDVLVNFCRDANKIMGTTYVGAFYAVRTSGTWSTPAEASAGGQVDYYLVDSVVGASDRTHFFWETSNGSVVQRAINSDDSLQTETTTTDTNEPESTVSYNDSGTQRIVSVGGSNSYRFNSASSPSISEAATGGTSPARAFEHNGTVYLLYRDSSTGDLYIKESTDNGATWGSATEAFGSITVANDFNALSHDGAVYDRGGLTVIPYIVNDNGTWKYNEYSLSSTNTKKRFVVIS